MTDNQFQNCLLRELRMIHIALSVLAAKGGTEESRVAFNTFMDESDANYCKWLQTTIYKIDKDKTAAECGFETETTDGGE